MQIPRPIYHLTPETGLMEGPDGVFIKNGIYHIYYQHSPQYPNKVVRRWGHFATKDFLKYTELLPTILPGDKYDKSGVCSGSAYPCAGKVCFYYTGLVRQRENRKQFIVKAESKDGTSVKSKEKLLSDRNLPKGIKNASSPRVFLSGGNYYMTVCGKDKNDNGNCYVYKSQNSKEWTQSGAAVRDGAAVSIENAQYADGFLMFVIKDIANRTNGCFYSRLLNDITDKNISLGKKIPLDYGFDFNTFYCYFDGARYIGYAALWNPVSGYVYEEQADGYQNCLSIPRVVKFTKRGITQKPLPELKKLRKMVVRAEAVAGDSLLCDTNSFELYVLPDGEFSISVRGVTISSGIGELSIEIKNGARGVGKMPYYGKSLRIFSDSTSIEIFSSGRSFSSRVYTGEPKVVMKKGSALLRMWRMKPVTIFRGERDLKNL